MTQNRIGNRLYILGKNKGPAVKQCIDFRCPAQRDTCPRGSAERQIPDIIITLFLVPARNQPTQAATRGRCSRSGIHRPLTSRTGKIRQATTARDGFDTNPTAAIGVPPPLKDTERSLNKNRRQFGFGRVYPPAQWDSVSQEQNRQRIR